MTIKWKGGGLRRQWKKIQRRWKMYCHGISWHMLRFQTIISELISFWNSYVGWGSEFDMCTMRKIQFICIAQKNMGDQSVIAMTETRTKEWGWWRWWPQWRGRQSNISMWKSYKILYLTLWTNDMEIEHLIAKFYLPPWLCTQYEGQNMLGTTHTSHTIPFDSFGCGDFCASSMQHHGCLGFSIVS